MAAFLDISVRLAALAVWTALLFACRLLAVVFVPVAPAVDKALRKIIFRVWGKGALALFKVRTTVEGTPPREPFFLVSNHLTFLDIILLASQLGCVFVSRADVQRWPLLGFVTRWMNTIYIDRERPLDTLRVMQLIAGAMEQGYGVHVFAEGRIGSGEAVQAFKPALLEPAIRMGWPVHYAVITYRTGTEHTAVPYPVVWPNGVGIVEHAIALLRLPGIDAVLTFGSDPVDGKDRKELAGRLWQAVRDKYVPAY